ncbi:MAG TPA: response regulator [Candidatus Polarisedimenticolia bacterium]|nr:response regulator [Candidatus Polarisedimenticolia bacterium]
MAVVGSLEDLSFPDILQVVHVSRQSGTLILSGPKGERRVRFRDGLVCGATLGPGGPELEELLLQRGHVDAKALQAARARQATSGETLSGALVALGSVAQETIEVLVRDELRSILRALVLLQEGEFRFELDEAGEAPSPELAIPGGLGPDTILQGVAGPGGAASRPGRDRRARVPVAARQVLLVIDRSVVRYALRDELLKRHFQVEACSTPAAGVDLARSLVRRGEPFALVCDLFLPDATGRGWQGGLDLLAKIRRLAPGLLAIMVGEVRDPGAAQAARAAGAAGYVPLPDLGAGALEEVGPRLSRFCGEVRAALYHPRRLEGGLSPTVDEPLRVVDQLSLLRGLIGEMHAEEQTEIPLLVLRLAAEYFERGILFAVRGGEACGSGAFGGDGDGGAGVGLDGRVRGVALPILRGSLLARTIQERATYVGPIARSKVNAALLERLGHPAPAEAAFLPLVGGRQVFGVLYGDNALSGTPLGDLKGLEIFLSQAGIALENATLKGRIQSLASGPPRG